jgi:hypothetical protein
MATLALEEPAEEAEEAEEGGEDGGAQNGKGARGTRNGAAKKRTSVVNFDDMDFGDVEAKEDSSFTERRAAANARRRMSGVQLTQLIGTLNADDEDADRGGVDFASNGGGRGVQRALSGGMWGLRAGPLFKRAVKSGRNWKRRFFVLARAEDLRGTLSIAYYKDQTAVAGKRGRGGTPLNSFELPSGTTAWRTSGSEVEHAFVVEVGGAAGGLRLFCAGQDEASADGWVTAITKAVEMNQDERRGSKVIGVGTSGLEGIVQEQHGQAKGVILDPPTASNGGASGGAGGEVSAGAGPRKAGYLAKRTRHAGRSWKRRYFMIDASPRPCIRYYATEYDLDNEKGMMVLGRSSLVVSAVDLQSGGDANCASLYEEQKVQAALQEVSALNTKGQPDAIGCTLIIVTESDSKDEKQVLFLRTESDHEARAWVSAVREVLEALPADDGSNGDFTCVASKRVTGAVGAP